jgi:tetratricopeptide (TPR) repeat protein
MKNGFLSRFTPSLMAPDALESIFVQRGELARDLVAAVRSAVESRRGEHILLVGPRGVGKTHLISLVFYRLQKCAELQGALSLAWLREEEWGVTSFLDFLVRLLRAIAAQDPEDQALAKNIESLYKLKPELAEMGAAGMIRDILRRQAVLVLVENCDELLHQIRSEGRLKLRDFLKANSGVSVLGTAQSGWDGFLAPDAPFRNMFEVRRLAPLSFDHAVELLSRIAAFEGDEALASFLSTPRGRARVHALEFLAGGNHRAYVVFSRFLTRDSLEEVVEPLVRAIDDLTPYYQARMAWLSPDQRKVIELLCEYRRPMKLDEISRQCFTVLEASKRCLEGLEHLGHVQSLKIGGDTYFELCEPLMRLSIEVKKHRGTPLRLLTDFLRLWYSTAELKSKLAVLPAGNELTRKYVLSLVEEAPATAGDDPRVASCRKEYEAAAHSGNLARALVAAEELASIRGSARDHQAVALCLWQLGRREEAAAACERIQASAPADAGAWLLHASTLSAFERHYEAVRSCDRALAIDKALVGAWELRASELLQLGLARESLAACEQALILEPDSPRLWFQQGSTLAELECYVEAARSFETMAQLSPQDPVGHLYRAAALTEARQYQDALGAATAALSLDQSLAGGWLVRGLALAGLGRGKDALDSLESAARLGEHSALLHARRAEILLHDGRWREAAAALDASLSMTGGAESDGTGSLPQVVKSLLDKSHAPVTLELGVRLLILLCRKHRALNALAQALVACIPDVLSAAFGADSSAVWHSTWQEQATSFPEFRLPLKLLSAACAYRASGDARVLLELPLEERRLLEPLLDIPVKATA